MAPVSKIIGTKTTLWVQAALTSIDVVIVEPPGDYLRYDLAILLDDGTYRRVQVKHARLDKFQKTPNSALIFKTTSEHNNNADRKSISTNYRGVAEFFGVYNEYTERAYLIPVNDVSIRSATLRLSPPSNNQKKKVRYARDYEITPANKQVIIEMIRQTQFECNSTIPMADETTETEITIIEEEL